MMNNYDVIVAGAGSLGVPIAMALGNLGVKTLVVDKYASPGQGENKHAIGGIRATHSDPAKILTGLRSLEIFSTWQEMHGDDIEWLKGGYLFPAYRETEASFLKGILPIQKKFGLNIDFIGPESIKEIVPGISGQGLMGGSFSPEDGSASPLRSVNAFYRHAVANGVKFHFREKIHTLLTEHGGISGVATDQGEYHAPVVVDAAGAYSRALCQTVGEDIPVFPDAHEAAVTEPVACFFACMVVDLRPAAGSKNYYFYQNAHGHVICCITPDPPIAGTDRRETSVFLPQISMRMLNLLPRLKNLRVRRVWRGLYPMSPDGSPLLGWNRNLEGLLHATGMCGQGYMLGPGIGEVVARMITRTTDESDGEILRELSPYRKFSNGKEALK